MKLVGTGSVINRPTSGGGNGSGGGGGGEGGRGDRAASTVVILVQSGFPWQDMTSTDYRIVLLLIKV